MLSKVSKKVIFISLAILLFAVLLGSIAYWYKPAIKPYLQEVMKIDKNATKWQESSAQETQENSHIAIPGYKEIKVKADTTIVSVPFRNPETNEVYFMIKLSLEDGTELFKSDLIEPGKGLNQITLSKALKVGTYRAVLNYSTFGLADQKPQNGANVNLDIIAE